MSEEWRDRIPEYSGFTMAKRSHEVGRSAPPGPSGDQSRPLDRDRSGSMGKENLAPEWETFPCRADGDSGYPQGWREANQPPNLELVDRGYRGGRPAPSDSAPFNDELRSGRRGGQIEPSDRRPFHEVYRNRRNEARSEASDSRTFNEEYRNRYRMAQNEPSDNNRSLNNEYRNEISRDRTGSTGIRSAREEYRNEYERDRLATSGHRNSTVRSDVGSGTGSSVPMYRDRSESGHIGSPGESRSDTHQGRGSASDREIERHLSRTPRGRSPSLERGVRFQENYRPQWLRVRSIIGDMTLKIEEGTTPESGKVGA
jgi:hypothetical protein